MHVVEEMLSVQMRRNLRQVRRGWGDVCRLGPRAAGGPATSLRVGHGAHAARVRGAAPSRPLALSSQFSVLGDICRQHQLLGGGRATSSSCLRVQKELMTLGPGKARSELHVTLPQPLRHLLPQAGRTFGCFSLED